MRLPVVTFLYVFVCSLALAQTAQPDVHHNNLTFEVGPAIPVGKTTNYLNTAPFIGFAYGYRFNQLFQADAGFQMAFGAANNQNAELTGYGQVRGGDHEFMFPLLGGRIFLPLHSSRIEASVGAGAVHLHYSETASTGGGYGYGYGGSACYTCTSRGGWGGYGMGNVSYFLDSNHQIRIGTTLQYVAASTNGQAVANIPAVKTTDHWLQIAIVFGFSF